MPRRRPARARLPARDPVADAAARLERARVALRAEEDRVAAYEAILEVARRRWQRRAEEVAFALEGLIAIVDR